MLKVIIGFLAASGLCGCAVQQISDGGPSITRVIKVPARDVAVYADAAEVPGRYVVIEEVYVKDDGSSLPNVLEGQLREMAGARGANALILAPSNRKLNGTRIDLRVQLDNPFDYYAGTAVWIGNGSPPVKIVRD